MTARGWYILLPALLFLLLGSVGHAQPVEQPTSEISLSNTESALASLLDNLKTLKRLLEERRIALQKAQQQLAELQSELLNLRERLTTSQLEIARLTELLRQSDATLSELQTSFEEYQKEAQRHTRRAWLFGGLGGAVLGLIGGLLL